MDGKTSVHRWTRNLVRYSRKVDKEASSDVGNVGRCVGKQETWFSGQVRGGDFLIPEVLF